MMVLLLLCSSVVIVLSWISSRHKWLWDRLWHQTVWLLVIWHIINWGSPPLLHHRLLLDRLLMLNVVLMMLGGDSLKITNTISRNVLLMMLRNYVFLVILRHLLIDILSIGSILIFTAQILIRLEVIKWLERPGDGITWELITIPARDELHVKVCWFLREGTNTINIT